MNVVWQVKDDFFRRGEHGTQIRCKHEHDEEMKDDQKGLDERVGTMRIDITKRKQKHIGVINVVNDGKHRDDRHGPSDVGATGEYQYIQRGRNARSLLNAFNAPLGRFRHVASMLTVLFAWGSGSLGQLGVGCHSDQLQPTFVRGFDDSTSLSFAAGANHVVLIVATSQESTALVWGDAQYAQLWDCERSTMSPVALTGPFFRALAKPIRAVGAGWLFSVVVDANNVLYTCGQYTPALKFASPRALLVDRRVVRVACGMNHALAIVDDDAVAVLYGWGDNKHGQIGVQAGATLVSEPQRVDDNVRPRAIACGRRHSAVVTVDRTLVAFGSNRHGQLGVEVSFPDRVLPLDDVRCMWDATALMGARSNDGSFGVYVVGKDVFGATLINRSSIVRWRALSCGSEHLAAVDIDGRLHMYGWNEHGQLGRNDTEPLHESAVDGVVALDDRRVIDVACGAGFTLAVICEETS